MVQYSNCYDEDYFMHGNGSCYRDFHYMGELGRRRAKAFASAAEVPAGARILDYGCGMGAITVGLNELGYDATGVDISSWPIEHCLPQARGSVFTLQQRPLVAWKNDAFDAVIAKDVFEHIPVSALQQIVRELLRIAPRLVFLVPVCDESGRFIRATDEQDVSHITRLTREQWSVLFPYRATECSEVLESIKGEHAYGSLCVRLER
jgi:SAM-dependent methyltransferase